MESRTSSSLGDARHTATALEGTWQQKFIAEAGKGAMQVPHGATIFIVDDDSRSRELLRGVLGDEGWDIKSYASCESFFASYRPDGPACLLVDACLPGMQDFELLQRLRMAGHLLPAIMITGNGNVRLAVQAMKAGAYDYIEKPVRYIDLLDSIGHALKQSLDVNRLLAWRENAAHHLLELTARQHQIMKLVLAGQASKIIAADLGISQRTVENHRASIMKKTGSKSIPALAQLALAAAAGNEDGASIDGSPDK